MAGEGHVVAVVGASGLFGTEVLRLLDERLFPAGEVRLLGSLKTAGGTVGEGARTQTIGLLGPQAFEGVDIAIFVAGPTVAGEHADAAADAGAAVIDTSSRFRLDAAVPLVVPEVNPEAIADRRERGIVASPSSTSIALSVVLAPLAAEAGLRRVVASTYQGVAGAGRRGLNALSKETIDLLNGRGDEGTHFHRRIAFNVLPEIGNLEPGGATTHELRVVEETRRVLDDPALGLLVTAVRVPVFFGTGISVSVETERPLDAAAATELLRTSPGILLHETAADAYPTPAEIAGSEATHVGRIRDDPTTDNGVVFWVALDNVTKGCALNAVQIAEILVRDYL